MRLDGKHALVTGGGSGIGAATVRRLREEGARVTVADIDEVSAKEVADEVDGHAVALDVTDAESVRDAMADATLALGPVDVLVNCAGGDRAAMFVDTDEQDWQRVLALNLTGAMACARAVLPSMLERRTGAIVNVASEAGRVGTFGGAPYAAAKAGLLGFTKSVAREVARFGVRCNAVAPGPIETPMLAAVGDRLREGMVAATIMGRAGQPHEVAAAIAYLASDDASFVTGETLSVSGGLSMI